MSKAQTTGTYRIPVARRQAERDMPQAKSAADVEFLESLAYWLDGAFRIPILGWRFGVDALLDLIPGIGDALGAIASLYIFQAARQFGLPRITLVRMALNIAIDFIGGLLPIAGALFDAYWKANLWNVALLKRHLAATPQESRRARRGDTLFVVMIIAVMLATMLAAAALVYWVLAALVHLVFAR
ncbi:MAG TPA: DUF4112 domain-containing protein [Pirellulales bacterium]|jgi:hypothetical protein